jgi:hypothetical protein
LDHAPSKRRYQIARKDGELWHRELLIHGGAEDIVLAEFPLKLGIGSGRHGRSYVAEVDGFLVQSPVTWYPARKQWGMSPGYDRPDQMGFERAIDESCLICHAGHADVVGKTQQRIHIREAAISCERCHGPGSLHVGHHRDRKQHGLPSEGGVDYTIVNPRHLERDLAEAVCQQCHLQSAAIVLGRGRKIADFRPGLPLQDFRQDYRLEVADAPMRVVGHVEQMHQSRCYKKSPTFSCATCHNPHAFPDPDKRDEFYQKKCLQCHQVESCTVDRAEKMRENPSNVCVRCHMPSAATDVPHVTFTHHRVGIHKRDQAGKPPVLAQPTGPGTLQPVLSLERLGAMDRKRSLGIAYDAIAQSESNPTLAAHYRAEALRLLSASYAAGMRDPALEVGLARLNFDRAGAESLAFAENALKHENIAGPDRCAALYYAASGHLKRNDFQAARKGYLELTTLRRLSDDYVFLAKCEKALGNQAGLIDALRSAVRIEPRIWPIHGQLSEHFSRLGDVDLATFHQKRAVR